MNVLSQLGRFNEAIEHAGTAVPIGEAAKLRGTIPVTGGSNVLVLALLHLGQVHLRRGNLPQAIRVLERCLETRPNGAVPRRDPAYRRKPGRRVALAGRPDEALPLVAGAVEDGHRRQLHTRPPGLILLFAGMT